MNLGIIEHNMKGILDQIYGSRENWIQDDNLRDTPRRYAKMMVELTRGLRENEIKWTEFKKGNYNDMVIIKDIPFFSICSHHLIPFFGTVSIVYIPDKKVIGLSKIPRLVKHIAAQPQLQERMSYQIADTLKQKLDTSGIMVIIKARHLCMEMRGVKSIGSNTITSAIRGIFKEDQKIREEALSLILN